MPIKNWSTNPDDNDAAAPYGWKSGVMTPSQVEPTVRRVMADVRQQCQTGTWFDWGDVPTYVSATSFTVPGDVTSRYTVNLRLQLIDTTTPITLYGTVLSAIYSAPNTTISVYLDSGGLTSDLDSVALSMISPESSPLPSLMANRANLVIGGNFDNNPSQDGTSFTSVANGTYIADMFRYEKTGTMVHNAGTTANAPTVAQAGLFSINSLLVDCTTAQGVIGAGNYCFVYTPIEGYNFLQIAQRPFVLSFWVKATKTGTYCVSFRNAGGDKSYVAEYDIINSGTWEKKVIQVSASPSDGTWNYTNSAGLYVSFALAVGSTYQTTAGTWESGNFLATSNQVNACDSATNNFQIQFVQVESGSQATEFQGRTIQEEIELCYRYYFISPHTFYTWSTHVEILPSVNFVLAPIMAINFPKIMRQPPSITKISGGDSDFSDVTEEAFNAQFVASIAADGQHSDPFSYVADARL